MSGPRKDVDSSPRVWNFRLDPADPGFPTRKPRLGIGPAGEKGRGVFALEAIPARTPVLRLEGRILRGDELTEDMLAMQIDDDLWLASDGSLLDDMVNHSCEPNTGFLDGTPILYALRDIAPGEEITWDYSTSLSERGWFLRCRCGSPRCRGIIRPWPELSEAEQERLFPITLNYLRGRLGTNPSR